MHVLTVYLTQKSFFWTRIFLDLIHTSQQDMMAVNSKAYYDMVLKQGKQIETLLNKNTIRAYYIVQTQN